MTPPFTPSVGPKARRRGAKGASLDSASLRSGCTGGAGRAALLILLLSTPALASGLTDHGEDLTPRERTEVRLAGYLRFRGESLHNLDLDRGNSPSGRPLFPVPLAEPTAQDLSHADARLRADLAIYAFGGGVAVKVRTDVLDNLVLGGSPELSPGTGTAPTPAASAGQLPLSLVRIKRAYAEALTPVGLLSAGRMGAHWGLGMLSHGGDCLDCDGGEAADRVAFVTPLAGHLWAAAYDFSAVGPTGSRRAGLRSIDLDPSDDVRTLTFALMRYRDDFARARRRAAGKSTLEYGLTLSYRTQANDVPASYLPAETPTPLDPSQVMRRGYRALVADGWTRMTWPRLTIEAEAAAMLASVEQASLIPGVLMRDAVSATQMGAALQSEVGAPGDDLTFGLDLGFASGDPAPGFGAYPPPGGSSTPGELDGPQASLPRDTRVDNFRFSPDYRIDRILFSEIIGTVTDALYLRPHARYRLLSLSTSSLDATLAAIGSRALQASSTPGGQAELGVELDSGLVYRSRDGFEGRLDYALLFPLAGLSNPEQGLQPTPAQLLRLRLAYVF